jgi:outer membrane biosynthesis protein TonB
MTSRCLRVGVLLRDQLVEERVFDGSVPITLGQSLRATLSVPVDGVPALHVLFGRDQGSWVLRTFAGMDGRLGQADKLDVIDGVREVPLARGCRGKLKIGEATILFQDIARPPVTPKPQLPASIRGTFADRIDRRLAVIIGGSLIMHISIAAWAWATDREIDAVPTAPLAQYVPPPGLVVDASQIPDEPIDPKAPGVAAPAQPQHQTHHIVQPVHPTIEQPAAPKIDAAQLAAVFGETPNEIGRPGTDLHSHAPGSHLAKQIDDLAHSGRPVTIGDPNHVSRADDNVHAIETPGRPISDNPTLDQLDHTTDAGERPVRIHIDPAHTDEPTTLTPEVVLDMINGHYMSGLKRCYRKALNIDAQLSGKVKLSFTVDARGNVLDPEASGTSGEMDGCVQTYMKSWHFPIPHDADGDATETSFQVSLALQPS